jgi:transketolase
MALMRALPNMAVLDLADAAEITQAVTIAADHPGPVYLRLKRGDIPVIFDADHRLELGKAHVLQEGRDVALVASGMMVPAMLAAARLFGEHGISVTLINSPTIKPLDSKTVVTAARASRLMLTVENHSVIGGLGSAVAEALAEAGVGTPLRRIGIDDVFAESGSREYLFQKYGLDVARVVEVVWSFLGRREPMPEIPVLPSSPGTYAPV